MVKKIRRKMAVFKGSRSFDAVSLQFPLMKLIIQKEKTLKLSGIVASVSWRNGLLHIFTG